MISRRRRWLAVIGTVAMLALPGSAVFTQALAQSTPMRFIVGLAPGGAVAHNTTLVDPWSWLSRPNPSITEVLDFTGAP